MTIGMPKMTWSRDRFYTIEDGYHDDGTFFMHPLIMCMWCGTELVDFAKSYEDGSVSWETHPLLPETPDEHYERCGRFKE